jgi:hypothetical protein
VLIIGENPTRALLTLMRGALGDRYSSSRRSPYLITVAIVAGFVGTARPPRRSRQILFGGSIIGLAVTKM